VANDIEVHFDPVRGYLSLSCGCEAFVRLRDAVCAEGAVQDIVRASGAEVREIEIALVPAVTERVGRLRSGLFLLGCSLAGFAVVFVFVTGVVTIARWFM
jgi:hypothetical protein